METTGQSFLYLVVVLILIIIGGAIIIVSGERLGGSSATFNEQFNATAFTPTSLSNPITSVNQLIILNQTSNSTSGVVTPPSTSFSLGVSNVFSGANGNLTIQHSPIGNTTATVSCNIGILGLLTNSSSTSFIISGSDVQSCSSSIQISLS